MSEDEAINKATKFVQKYREKERKFYDYLFSMKENDIPIQSIETILDLYNKEKEKNKNLIIITNKLMPLAECSYWDYENHACSHTCGGCDGLNVNNKRTETGILIDKDRYCRLYEDGDAEEDTKYVNVEDLIKRHLEVKDE